MKNAGSTNGRSAGRRMLAVVVLGAAAILVASPTAMAAVTASFSPAPAR